MHAKYVANARPQYPFEFAKTRTQLQATRQSNPFAIIAQVARNDGVRALYTGCSTLIIVSLGPPAVMQANRS